MDSTSKTRCAVIGCGVIGPVHIDAITRCADAELVAVCDIIPERAAACAATCGATPYADFHEMLAAEKPDVVTIGTPHYNHAEIAIAALEAGAHVLCEKVLALSDEQMTSMITTAERLGLTLGGVFQHRHDPVVCVIKDAVEAGTFGRILNAGAYIHCFRSDDYYNSGDWRGTWDGEGGGVLINQAIHSVDLMQWLAGPVQSVYGQWRNLVLGDCVEVEDTVSAALQFRSGALGTLEATCSSHLDFAAGVYLYGTDGSMRMAGGGRDVIDMLKMRDPAIEAELRAKITIAIQSDMAHERGPVGKECYGVAHVRQVADFIAAVREGREPMITARSARHAADIVQAVFASARQNLPVDVVQMP